MIIKRKLKNLDNKTGKKIIMKLKTMMGNHERYKKCFFWSQTGNASSRRQQEFEQQIIFNLNGVEYCWEQNLEISCKNFYWTSSIKKDNKKTTILSIKKLLNIN